MSETPAERADRIAADPDAASDSDKLRNVADVIDMIDQRFGFTGTQAQEFLRGLAERLDAP